MENASKMKQRDKRGGVQGSKERDVKLDSIGCQRDSWAPPCSVQVRDIMEMINNNYQAVPYVVT